MNPSSLAPLLSPAPVSFPRRVVASLSFLGIAAIAWTFGGGAISAASLGALALASLAVQSANLFAQVFASAVAWCSFALFALASLLAVRPTLAISSVVALAAVAVLSTGLTPLFGSRAEAQFSPLAARRSFVVACVGAVVASAALFALGLDAAVSHHPNIAVAALPLALLGVAGVAGVLRMRAWGLLATATAGGTSSILALTVQLPRMGALLGVHRYDRALVSVTLLSAGLTMLGILVPLALARRDVSRAPMLSASGGEHA
jgi:hypothetical protein